MSFTSFLQPGYQSLYIQVEILGASQKLEVRNFHPCFELKVLTISMCEQIMSQNLHQEKQAPASMEDQLAQSAISSTNNGTITTPVNTISQNDEQIDVLSPRTLFTCFPRLASELRCKIWKTAANQLPRVLALHESCTTRIFGALGSTFVVLQGSKPPQPALLQVNHKSRRETIAMYELIFGTQFHIGSDPWVRRREFKALVDEPMVYFNASTDTIYFSAHFICGDFDPFGTFYPGRPVASVIKSLRSIAVDVEHLLSKTSPGIGL